MARVDMKLTNLKSQTHLSATNKRIFCIHGGGNIGLGCMADIVSRSPFNYHIIATSSDKFTNALINSNHEFWLRHGPNQYQVSCVRNVTMVDAKHKQNIIDLYCKADVLAICLTEKALINVASDIALALLTRHMQSHKTTLPIFILMNRLNNKSFVKDEIQKALLSITRSDIVTNKILKKIQWIPTVVDRIVNKIDKKNILMQLRQQLQTRVDHIEKDKIEPILSDQKALVNIIQKEKLVFKLFNAEQYFTFCVPEDFKDVSQFPDIQVVANLDQFAEIKNKYINGPHATLAWIGGLMGCKTISEAIDNPSLLWFINNLMEYEIGPILKAEYPTIKHSDLQLLKSSFIKRCRASSEDPIIRVGRDPLRKLRKGGRIQGVIELKRKHGLKIATPELERGVAAGILYAIKEVDPTNEECQKIHDLYQKKGSYQAVLCYKEPNDNSIYPGLDAKIDRILIHNILTRIASFERIYKIRRMNYAKYTKLQQLSQKY